MKKVITISATALAVLSMFFISFSFINTGSAHAESSSTQASLEIDPIINISTPSTITLNCTPGSTDAQAELCTSTANVIVTTNNITGYTLQMNATSSSPTALTNSAASPAATIPTLSQAYPSSNFPVNSWGYTGGLDKSEETGGYDCSTNYCPILAYNSDPTTYAPNHIIKQTDAPSNASTTPITFAGKVNTTKPSGTYTTSVTFTAVTNYARPSTMQNFTPSDCSRATTDQTFTLMDIRDGTNYTVAKLQDGNCWMTQNLELGEYGHPMTLTQADSNVSPSGYTLEFGSSNASIYKGNPNKYGNYYDPVQATAGSAVNTDGENAPYDICPKGWRLPSESGASTADDEFYIMLSNYISADFWNEGWGDTDISEWTSPPVSLVFAGYTSVNTMGLQGETGTWRSSTSLGYSNLEQLVLKVWSNGDVAPGDYSDAPGASIRCLIPGT